MGGTWKGGTWEDGTWKDGIWQGGFWKDGTWKDGTWKDGLWMGGTWKRGTWENFPINSHSMIFNILKNNDDLEIKMIASYINSFKNKCWKEFILIFKDFKSVPKIIEILKDTHSDLENKLKKHGY